MSWTWLLTTSFVILLSLFVVPTLVYLCVKLGVLAYLQAKFQWERKERQNGESSGT